MAVIPSENVKIDFDQYCSAGESFPKIKICHEYYDETWNGDPEVLVKEAHWLFQSISGIDSTLRQMAMRKLETTFEAAIGPSNSSWDWYAYLNFVSIVNFEVTLGCFLANQDQKFSTKSVILPLAVLNSFERRSVSDQIVHLPIFSTVQEEIDRNCVIYFCFIEFLWKNRRFS